MAAGLLWLVPDVVALGWSPPDSGVGRYAWYRAHPQIPPGGRASRVADELGPARQSIGGAARTMNREDCDDDRQ